MAEAEDESKKFAFKMKEFEKFVQSKFIVKYSDMDEEMRTDAIDIITSSIDKYSSEAKVDIELAATMAKDRMDKKYGAYWHCVMGEGFSFEVSAQEKFTLYMYHAGSLAVLLYKC